MIARMQDIQDMIIGQVKNEFETYIKYGGVLAEDEDGDPTIDDKMFNEILNNALHNTSLAVWDADDFSEDYIIHVGDNRIVSKLDEIIYGLYFKVVARDTLKDEISNYAIDIEMKKWI